MNLNEIVQQWWVQWHEESILRTRLTAVGTIDWDKVHASLKRSNLLLYTTTDRRLQRVARLTKVGLDVDLNKVGRWIYALVGAKPTYVGQTGCVIEPRAPLTRLKDHFAKAKALRRTWKAKRSMVRVEGWGVTPPLPRIMATFGMGVFSLVLMEEVGSANLGTAREAHNDAILAPTCNAVVPGGGCMRRKHGNVLLTI